jgi:2-amino-4-hydroxy-6-hydroxymethyldihydropteridine diphosphokinase
MQLVLAIGTNIGKREDNLNNAITLINNNIGIVKKKSAFYEMKPLGFISENYFLNAVIMVQTKLSVYQAFKQTKRVEKIMGRTQKSINGIYSDRIIDIDLLFYGNKILKTKKLTLPHPALHNRKFVLEPLNEILPKLVHPIFSATSESLLFSLLQEKENLFVRKNIIFT